ncbi:MAG TPA: hypothetical protein VER17_13755 [Tepidisphaeraceae bacterium]|nr:hypothetical protein [Tepidisphaeraceae bacterium]
MDKKFKNHRRHGPSDEEISQAASEAGASEAGASVTPDDTGGTPPGASFDTAAGRAAQGMRADIAAGGGDTVAGQRPSEPPLEGGMGGASDASSGGGAGAGIPGGGTDMRTDGRFSKGDIEEDRKKIFPEAKTKREK